MGDDETAIPQWCPDCGGRVLSACPACEAPIVSLMGIACRECGEPLREPELFGVEIRRKPEKGPIRAPAVDGEAASDDNVSRSR
jgi:predicted amidophosphoribosyltransferase